MCKRFFKKKYGKRLLAILLSLLTVLTCLTPAMSALAVNTTTVDDAIYIKEYWYGHTRLGIKGHIADKAGKDIQVTSDGKNHSAFCVQYGTSDSGSTCTNDGCYGWLTKTYSKTVRKRLTTVLAAAKDLGYSDLDASNAKYFAVQRLIWEVCDRGNSLSSGSEKTATQSYYDKLVAVYNGYCADKPSSDIGKLWLEYNSSSKKYEVTSKASDALKTGNWTVSDKGGLDSVTIDTKTGKIKVSNSTKISKATISLSNAKGKAKFQTGSIWKRGDQHVVPSDNFETDTDKITVLLDYVTPTANCRVRKRNDMKENVNGITFRLYSNYDSTINGRGVYAQTTVTSSESDGAGGYYSIAQWNGLDIYQDDGKTKIVYTIVEDEPTGWHAKNGVNAVSFTLGAANSTRWVSNDYDNSIVPNGAYNEETGGYWDCVAMGQTNKGSWIDYPERGDLRIKKNNDEGTAISGVTYHLKGYSNYGGYFDISTTTGADGYAYFCDMLKNFY